MLSSCYNNITHEQAKLIFTQKEISNKSYPVIFPFNDYNSPDADLSLTRDEEFSIYFLNYVFFH